MTSLSKGNWARKIKTRERDNVINLPTFNTSASGPVILPCHSLLKSLLKVLSEFIRSASNRLHNTYGLPTAFNGIGNRSPDSLNDSIHWVSFGSLSRVSTRPIADLLGIISSIFRVYCPLLLRVCKSPVSLSFASLSPVRFSVSKLSLLRFHCVGNPPSFTPISILFAPLVAIFGPISSLGRKIRLPIVSNPSPVFFSPLLQFS